MYDLDASINLQNKAFNWWKMLIAIIKVKLFKCSTPCDVWNGKQGIKIWPEWNVVDFNISNNKLGHLQAWAVKTVSIHT